MKTQITLIALLASNICFAQLKHYNPRTYSLEQQEVMGVILTLFEGMREADSAKIHKIFDDDVKMYTSYTDGDGKAHLREGALSQFLTAIGTPREQVYDEPIWNTKIEIDGNLAMVWTDYAFYLDKQFSHCGVDAFMLHKVEEHWKIYFLTDTRRKEGCELPEQIRKDRD